MSDPISQVMQNAPLALQDKVNFPWLRFEWHPQTKKVYSIELAGAWHDGVWVANGVGGVVHGNLIAQSVDTPTEFQRIVQTYQRGISRGAEACEAEKTHLLKLIALYRKREPGRQPIITG